MTVKSLIEKLSELPEDLEVYTIDAEWGEEEATIVEMKRIKVYGPWKGETPTGRDVTEKTVVVVE